MPCAQRRLARSQLQDSNQSFSQHGQQQWRWRPDPSLPHAHSWPLQVGRTGRLRAGPGAAHGEESQPVPMARGPSVPQCPVFCCLFPPRCLSVFAPTTWHFLLYEKVLSLSRKKAGLKTGRYFFVMLAGTCENTCLQMVGWELAQPTSLKQQPTSLKQLRVLSSTSCAFVELLPPPRFGDYP